MSTDQSTIRAAINDRIVQLGLTRYEFAHSGQVKAVPSTVYRFLNGDVETKSDTVDEMLHSLGLRIVAVRRRPEWVRELRKAS